MKNSILYDLWINIFVIFISGNLSASALTLNEVYQLATTKTESIAVAKSQLNISELALEEAKGSFRPTVSAGANYQLQNKIISAVGSDNQATAKITITQSIYSGCRDNANLEVASQQREFQKHNVTISKNSLYLSVAHSFYNLLAANKEVEDIKQSLLLTQKRITELNIRKKIGKARNIEVLAAEAQKSILEAQLLAAIGQSRNAQNIFTSTTGLESNVKLDDSVSLPKETKDINFYLTSLNERPDILGLKTKIKMSEFSLDAVAAARWPTLELSGNYYPYRYHQIQSGQDWDALLVLSIPIYSGGILQAKIREASEKQMQAIIQLKDQQRNADREIQTAYNSYMSAIDQIKAYEKAVSVTEQNYLEQEKDYRFSLATNLDVLQALNTHHDTKRTLDHTRYQALIALAELKAAANIIEE